MPRSLDDGVDKELALFQIDGKRSAKLEVLHRALGTIPPTSVESERVFSIASNFITKKRCSMSDSVLNALVFLKQFY